MSARSPNGGCTANAGRPAETPYNPEVTDGYAS